ncbi:MAG: aldehyde dehydrogenase family protein [Paracoccaceae bacterium]|nr:aldehyde dehydrogenase family protein [Paracoccaceae bacterium]
MLNRLANMEYCSVVAKQSGQVFGLGAVSSRERTEQSMEKPMSLSFDPSLVRLEPSHYIAGKSIKVPGEITIERPSDGKVFSECPIASPELVDQAVEAARVAVKASGWSVCHPRDRLKALVAWADLVEAHAQELGQIEAVPSTRLISEVVKGEIPIIVEQIRFFAELADKEGGFLAPTADTQLGLIEHEPYGVIGAITPWNFPMSMAIWKLAPALAAGNAVVLKPSEMTPFSAVRLAQLAEKAGLPKGLINIVQGDGATTGTALTGHPGIGKVSFTGSTRAGAAISQNVARTGLKPVTLELGGKSPQVVFADVEFDKTVDRVIRGIMPNAGQACVSGSRLLVEETLANRLITAVKTRMQDIRPGPTWDAEATYSPVISKQQRTRIDKIVQETVAEGAELLCGGTPIEREGYYYTPTILGNVAQTSRAVREEVFGPVLTVQTFRDEDEALALADHPDYGLCAGVHTQNMSRAIRMARSIQAGTVWVNRYGRSRDHILPSGGYKSSGIGKDLGREAYLGAMRSKTILVDF